MEERKLKFPGVERIQELLEEDSSEEKMEMWYDDPNVSKVDATLNEQTVLDFKTTTLDNSIEPVGEVPSRVRKEAKAIARRIMNRQKNLNEKQRAKHKKKEKSRKKNKAARKARRA